MPHILLSKGAINTVVLHFALLQPHNFQSQAGKYTCNPCAAGSEAPGSGNIACSKCAKGWYNPFSGQFSDYALFQHAV